MGGGSIFPTTGRLLHSMREAGISQNEIGVVAITHAHPDHIGGALDENGELICPDAQYYISRREWGFWHQDESSLVSRANIPAAFVSFIRAHLGPMVGQVIVVDGESEIVPGIRAIPAPGHTPGHMIIEVASAGEMLRYIGDTVLHPLHLEHPDWLPIYDILPEEAGPSKHDVFDKAAQDQALVMGQHFPPFPSLGHIIKGDPGWRWVPIEAAT
jgi:glyoxylase-like metal-dependent hydrolase (beta-lactamase superfamily II)